MRALIVTNLYPTEAEPRRGRFVADQVDALRDLGADVELFTFPLGARAYPPATRRLRAHLRSNRYDVVHAHYGLCGWVAALAGADPLVVTFHGTDIRHRVVGPGSRRLLRRIDLAAGVSGSAFRPEGGRPGLPRGVTRAAVLPCGAELDRFAPIKRDRARRELGLDEAGRYLLFAADPKRAVKRHDRAAQVAGDAGAILLTAGDEPPERMPLLINAAAAVLVTSETEGFGLSCVEALACDVPVISTPVGIAPLAAGGIEGCLVAPFKRGPWAEFATQVLERADPRVAGRGAAERFSARAMADRVLAAWDGIAAGGARSQPRRAGSPG